MGKKDRSEKEEKGKVIIRCYRAECGGCCSCRQGATPGPRRAQPGHAAPEILSHYVFSARQVDITDVMIHPQKTTPPLDASKWPLLLKNYDKLNVRHMGHSLACLSRQEAPCAKP